MTECPICGYRFETAADYDAHVPCPEPGGERFRTTGPQVAHVTGIAQDAGAVAVSSRKIVDEAILRYMRDAKFHARARLTLQVLDEYDFAAPTLMAASIALVLAEHDPLTVGP